MSIDPNEFCEKLKQNSTARTAKTLDLVNKICVEQADRGSSDFSIATIGRLSEAVNGPQTQTFRNKTGEKYKALVQAWASYKKPLRVASSKIKEKDAWVNDIINSRIKWLVKDLLAQNSKLKGQLQLAKEMSNIHIDLRPVSEDTGLSNFPKASLVKPTLTEQQRSALVHAINPKELKKIGWRVDERGKIKHFVKVEGGKADDGGDVYEEVLLFRAGFIDAIKTILFL